ncbi:hypothetical protein GGX14DRAFT_595803 [Mycena pura]|uniref:DNA/RNA-binding domain-containing protein n=1 Tax=Mycena pura TaxID=153505 RepID=A0AAD6US94_9AGAR|nr:hypothetical protein GGX14DRAFT_595803 [Mycena pura]
MTDQPAVVAREARSIQAGLKALLTRDVWSNYREADFQRKNLRRRYLHLLLLHPSAGETRDAGTLLWMQTSYAFIALYKQRLAKHAHTNNPNGGGSGPVETRKLQQRFRQFLADEERFWRALVLRVQRSYDIRLPPAVTLPPELVGEEETTTPEDRMNHFGFPPVTDPPVFVEVSVAQAASVLSKALVCLGDIARYREQYRAPLKVPAHVPESKKRLYEHRPNYSRARALYFAAHALAPHEGNASHQLAILAGYEGDTLASVAWYLRALCVRAPFDTAGENLAGVLTKALTHPQARAAIEAAVSTVVVEGEHEQDEREESEPLRVRIERFKRDLVLLHALWREGSAPASQTLSLSAHTARLFARLVAARALPEELIVRVGVLAQGAVWVGRMGPALPAVAPASSVADAGDAEKGAKGGGAEEKDKERGRRRTKHKPAPIPAAPGTPAQAPRRHAVQQDPAHLAHLLALHTALLAVGVRELGEVDMYAQPQAPAPAPAPALPALGKGRRGRGAARGGPATVVTVGDVRSAETATSAKPELAERISAEFRRTLPALRVGSKWVIANWAWVCAAAGGGGVTDDAARAKQNGNGKMEAEKEHSEEELELSAQLVRFWAVYAEFLRRLARTFPVALLPALSLPVARQEFGGADAAGQDDVAVPGETVEVELELEEDLDMRGWLPLRGLMGGPCSLPSYDDDATKEMVIAGGQQGTLERRTVGLKEEVHPNVEQLMRIGDLLRDGRRIVELEGSPLALYGGQFVVKGVEAAKPVASAPVSAAREDPSTLAGSVRPGAPQTPVRALAAKSVAGLSPSDKLASIRDSRLAMHDIEEDAMTEKTSRTDDDILHDAFSFLNKEGTLEESDEDEIVWDLRDAPVSPTVPTARTSPRTPLRPPPIGPPSRTTPSLAPAPLPPIGPPSRTTPSLAPAPPPPIGPPSRTTPSLAPAPPPLSPVRPLRSVSPGTQIPPTTALDLLNNVLSKAPKPVPSALPGESLLFGSRSATSPAQSIWSASRAEQGLMFSSGGGAIGQHPLQHQHQQAAQYHGLGQPAGLSQYVGEHTAHQNFASQDLSTRSTVWASSYPTANEHNAPASLAHPPVGPAIHPHHRRVVSSSMAAAQLFPSGSDPYGYGPPVPAAQYAGGHGVTPAHEQPGVFYATSPAAVAGQGFAAQSQGQSYHGHGRHTSLSVPGPRSAFHGQAVTPMSQLWGNVG